MVKSDNDVDRGRWLARFFCGRMGFTRVQRAGPCESHSTRHIHPPLAKPLHERLTSTSLKFQTEAHPWTTLLSHRPSSPWPGHRTDTCPHWYGHTSHCARDRVGHIHAHSQVTLGWKIQLLKWCDPLSSWVKNRSRHHQCQAEARRRHSYGQHFCTITVHLEGLVTVQIHLPQLTATLSLQHEPEVVVIVGANLVVAGDPVIQHAYAPDVLLELEVLDGVLSRHRLHAVPKRIECAIGSETFTTTQHRDANTPLHIGVTKLVQSADAEHVVTTASVVNDGASCQRDCEGHRGRFRNWSRGQGAMHTTTGVGAAFIAGAGATWNTASAGAMYCAQRGTSSNNLNGLGQPNPNERWREAEGNLRKGALCATHRHQNPSRSPSSVPKRIGQMPWTWRARWKSKILPASCALGESRGSEEHPWAKRDAHRQKVPSICIPPWAGGSVTIMVGECDLQGHPLGFAPRSTRTQNGVNTHSSKNTFVITAGWSPSLNLTPLSPSQIVVVPFEQFYVGIFSSRDPCFWLHRMPSVWSPQVHKNFPIP